MRRAPLVMLILGLVLAGGCASGSRASGPDVMGFTLEIQETRPGRAYALYRVARDGTLSFGGGLDARQGKPSWSGPLSVEEQQRLAAIIDEGRWRSSKLPSPGVPEGTSYEIRMQWDGGRCVHRIDGAPPSVEQAVALLANAAQRRNTEFMRSLPQPGAQP